MKKSGLRELQATAAKSRSFQSWRYAAKVARQKERRVVIASLKHSDFPGIRFARRMVHGVQRLAIQVRRAIKAWETGRQEAPETSKGTGVEKRTEHQPPKEKPWKYM